MVLIAGLPPWEGDPYYYPPQTHALVATLWIKIPKGTRAQVVDFDSAFAPPAGELIFCRGYYTLGAIIPNYIDCGAADLIIQPPYDCGDANGDGSVDISDAVFLIAYIFSGGPAPNPPLAGDASCDQTVDISDAVYLIQYIFAGGPGPCTACK